MSRGHIALAGLAAVIFAAGPSHVGFAQSPVQSSGVPAQVIPAFTETGAPTFTPGTGTFGSSQGGTGTGAASDPTGGTSGGTVTPGGDSYNALAAQSYGSDAIAASQALGVNPNATAAIGQAESGFRNVATAGGLSSATGPWQITGGTWNYFVNKYNLPYTSADVTNPDAQAAVAPYIIRDYAMSVQQATGDSPTAAQVYGAFVYGPSPGGRIAAASDDTPLSNFASATALANNRMTGWTVGQFNSWAANRLGSVASQSVI